MNNPVFDDWNIDIENLPKEPNINIEQIKIIHHYFNDKDIEPGYPIETSVEFISKIVNANIEWVKKIKHIYRNIKNPLLTADRDYEKIVKNQDEILEKLNNINLSILKNNYSYDSSSKEEYWEIIYNNRFKIVGTYRNELKEFNELCDLLEFETIKNEELEQVKKMLKKENGDISYGIQ